MPLSSELPVLHDMAAVYIGKWSGDQQEENDKQREYWQCKYHVEYGQHVAVKNRQFEKKGGRQDNSTNKEKENDSSFFCTKFQLYGQIDTLQQ